MKIAHDLDLHACTIFKLTDDEAGMLGAWPGKCDEDCEVGSCLPIDFF